ncbi:hypothetical protein HY988_00885 [Candidatus Micrarchaeota archaeon]|nr:hypothetical protein [Candidatus Micrarchaeota archaeon]
MPPFTPVEQRYVVYEGTGVINERGGPNLYDISVVCCSTSGNWKTDAIRAAHKAGVSIHMLNEGTEVGKPNFGETGVFKGNSFAVSITPNGRITKHYSEKRPKTVVVEKVAEGGFRIAYTLHDGQSLGHSFRGPAGSIGAALPARRAVAGGRRP